MTVCAHCSKELREYKEVHAAGGFLYCSKACAIAHITNNIILNAKERATTIYYDEAEIVATADILGDEIERGDTCG